MIEIRLAESDGDVDRALDLAEQVWGTPPVSLPVARALTLAGWYVALAHPTGRADPHGGPPEASDPVGMCAGFVGVHDGELHLHSHLAAVLPGEQGQGIGRALKRHQREWCLGQGIGTISWTFDPLVRENARFNLHHLGAVGERYLVDLYGPMDDEINHGQPSDRLLVRWDLRAERTVAALDLPLATPRADRLREAGAVDAVVAIDGTPTVMTPQSGSVRLVATPERIADLRRRDPDRALAWRHAVRDAMTAAFDDGLVVTALADDHSYVLGREPR